MHQQNYPLTNMQLELLKLFTRDIEETDLIEIKRMIVKYLGKKLAQKADKVWEEKQWTNDDMDNLLNMHLRTPYKKQN